MSVAQDFFQANELTLMGRRIWQIYNTPPNVRSYDLYDKHFALTGVARATVDGELVRRGLFQSVDHDDYTKSYVLTDRGNAVARDIAARMPKY
jgi:hypothetical protein